MGSAWGWVMGSVWRPIEDAPANDRILAYNAVVGIYLTKRSGKDEFPCFDWGGMRGRWYPRPTHWMPLPDPPEEQNG